ncbi:MAG: hypothetical protein ACLPLR_15075 [Terriglobales bacterium]
MPSRIRAEFALGSRRRARRWLWLVLMGASACAQGQICQSTEDMDASVRTALEAAAKRYFEMSARGDTLALEQNSIASVVANFARIEAAVKENQGGFSGAQATVRPPFLLSVEGPAPLARAEFLCGVFAKSGQTNDSAVFVLNNLPPGKYGVTILDVNGGPAAVPMTLTLVLEQRYGEWKLAGFFPRPSRAAGHDAAWFTQRASDFKAKPQNRNAWLYYREAIFLAAPVDMMSTLATDQLYDAAQAVEPSDVPLSGKTVDLSAGGKMYVLTEISPLAVGNDLDVVVRYQAADVSDTARTFQENTVVIKALVAKFPELRDAFAGVVARAVEPSGRDYGTLLGMKDIK